MEKFEKLLVWVDPVKRPGPEAMAVDEWLLGVAEWPILRVYDWAGDWASVGYFGEIGPARQAIPGVSWVRRWTGGGVVDHRADWTYSLVVPQVEALARKRGGESYRSIHAALQSALRQEGVEALLSAGEHQTGVALCFANPVGHDLVDSQGAKLAGAGQRRTLQGLLHQGSVALPCDPGTSRRRASRLAEALALETLDFQPTLDAPELAAMSRSRYANRAWLERR